MDFVDFCYEHFGTGFVYEIIDELKESFRQSYSLIICQKKMFKIVKIKNSRNKKT